MWATCGKVFSFLPKKSIREAGPWGFPAHPLLDSGFVIMSCPPWVAWQRSTRESNGIQLSFYLRGFFQTEQPRLDFVDWNWICRRAVLLHLEPLEWLADQEARKRQEYSCESLIHCCESIFRYEAWCFSEKWYTMVLQRSSRLFFIRNYHLGASNML